MNNNFVNDCFNCAKEIESNASILDVLAKSFHLTGNDKVAEKLYRRVDSLNEQAEKIRKICSDKTSKDLKDIEESTGNMIRAVLAVSEIKYEK